MVVSTALHAKVLQRDGLCFVRRMDPRHRCHDRFGTEHSPHDLSKLTVDHVHLEGAMMGKRAPDDERHMVAMCWAANVGCPSRSIRQAERQYLVGIYDQGNRD